MWQFHQVVAFGQRKEVICIEHVVKCIGRYKCGEIHIIFNRSV